MTEDIYWFWLSSLSGIGVKKFYDLYKYFKDIKNVYDADYLDLQAVSSLSRVNISTILNNKNLSEIYNYLKVLKNKDVEYVKCNEKEYPKYLKEIYLPPPILYYKGFLKPKDLHPSIAIVGSRKGSYYGIKMSQKIAYYLASNGINIVSGFARGVDTSAHIGALNANGKTTAIMGCGIDIVYPRESIKLFEKLIEKGIAISEFPLGTEPLANNFPRRNRIISGLSIGILVIEAGIKSGSLITAEFALEQGREVYALPGNVNSQTSKGTNYLIKEGAKLVANYKDILDDLIPFITIKELKNNKSEFIKNLNLNEQEKKIIEEIQKGILFPDLISNNTGISINKINSTLTMLELKGVIKKDRGRFYIK